MALRLQHERMERALLPSLGEYTRRWGLTRKRVGARPDAVVLHPGPMNRGVEIALDVADGPTLGDPRAGDERRRGALAVLCWCRALDRVEAAS